MSVADILAEAGVGRESFYDLFDDKRDCVLAAHTLLIAHLEATVRAIYDEPGPWVDRVRNSVAAMLDWFAADPAAARVAVVELAAMGPESRERFQEIFTRFSAILEEGREGAAIPDPARPHASELAIGAGLARVYEEVVRGRASELPNLLPELTYEAARPVHRRRGRPRGGTTRSGDRGREVRPPGPARKEFGNLEGPATATVVPRLPEEPSVIHPWNSPLGPGGQPNWVKKRSSLGTEVFSPCVSQEFCLASSRVRVRIQWCKTAL